MPTDRAAARGRLQHQLYVQFAYQFNGTEKTRSFRVNLAAAASQTDRERDHNYYLTGDVSSHGEGRAACTGTSLAARLGSAGAEVAI